MREIFLNCDSWKTRDDFYDAFFAAVRAPAWHGRNFDALNDSICTGEINEIELPYEIVISNAAGASGDALKIVNDFIDFIRDRAERGCESQSELNAEAGCPMSRL